MDILTHALLGIVAAGPFLERPVLAAGIVAGSVIPDLDALSRLFGKRAFLRHHQTYSHSLPVLGLLAAIISFVPFFGPEAGAGFFAGAAFHTLLDYSNTLGVRMLWPFHRPRMQLSWVFFIDAFVLVISLLGCAATLLPLFAGRMAGFWPFAFTFGTLAVYWILKAVCHRRARVMAGPQAVSVIPSALLPWKFFVCIRDRAAATVSLLNIRSGSLTPRENYDLLEESFADTLRKIPEWRLMCDLSPAYHAVRIEKSGTGSAVVHCRDLRTRNFNSTFGDLDVHLDAGGAVTQTVFHV